MLLFTRRLKLSGEQLEKIKNYCLSGKPIVGVRTASHAIQTWLDLDKLVLGGNYHGHYEVGPETKIAIVDRAKDHPVLAGVRPYRSAGSLYKNEGLSSDDEILMTGAIPGHTEPIAWTRMYKGRGSSTRRWAIRRISPKTVFAACWPTPCSGPPAERRKPNDELNEEPRR